MWHGQLPAVGHGERQLLFVVLGAIIETQSPNHLVPLRGIVQRGHRIHSAADEYDYFLHPRLVGCSAITVSESPPRAANFPSIRIWRGRSAFTRSSKIRLITSSLKEGTFR